MKNVIYFHEFIFEQLITFIILHFICFILLVGAVYLDLPATLLTQDVDESKIFKALPCPPPPLSYPDAKLIEQAANLLIRAKKPLVIVGKGKYIDLAESFTQPSFFLFFSYIFSIRRCRLRSS